MLLARRLGFVRTPATAAEDSWVPVKSAGEAAPPPPGEGEGEAVAFIEQERSAVTSHDFAFEQLERPAFVEPAPPPPGEGEGEAVAFIEHERSAVTSHDFAFEQLARPAFVEPVPPPPGLEGLASSEEPEAVSALEPPSSKDEASASASAAAVVAPAAPLLTPAAAAAKHVGPAPPLRQPPPWQEEASWRAAARAELAGVASLQELAAALWRLRAASAQLSWRAFFRRCNRLGLCLSSMVCHHADLVRRLQQDRSMRLPRWALKTDELRIVQRAFSVKLH